MPEINNPFPSTGRTFSDLDPEVEAVPLDALTIRRVTRRRDYALAVLRSAGVALPSGLVLAEEVSTAQIDDLRGVLREHDLAASDAVRLARIILLDAARLCRGAADATPVDD